MSIETLAFIALAALVVVLFLMIFIRDTEITKKLSIFERSIEDLNYQNHVLNKTLKELSSKQNDFDPHAFERMMIEKMKQEVQNTALPMLGSLREIESVLERFKEEQGSRIDRLESRTKEISSLSSPTSSSNEKMIVAQYNRGRSEAEIAKDLRIGIGEVDLVLKLANLK